MTLPRAFWFAPVLAAFLVIFGLALTGSPSSAIASTGYTCPSTEWATEAFGVPVQRVAEEPCAFTGKGMKYNTPVTLAVEFIFTVREPMYHPDGKFAMINTVFVGDGHTAQGDALTARFLPALYQEFGGAQNTFCQVWQSENKAAIAAGLSGVTQIVSGDLKPCQ